MNTRSGEVFRPVFHWMQKYLLLSHIESYLKKMETGWDTECGSVVLRHCRTPWWVSCAMAQQNTKPIKAVLTSCIVVPLFTGFFKTVTPWTVKVCSTLKKMMVVKLKWKKSTRKLRHDRKNKIKTNCKWVVMKVWTALGSCLVVCLGISCWKFSIYYDRVS